MNALWRNRKGLTLIEVLVAVVVTSIVMTGLLTGLHAGIIAWKRVEKGSARLQEVRLMLNLLEKDLRNMQSYSKVSFRGSPYGFTFPTLVDEYDEHVTTKSMAAVSYEYRADTLYRKKTPLRGQFLLGEGTSEKFISAIGSFVVQYAYKEDPGSKVIWQSQWLPAQGLPRGIQIRFKVSNQMKPSSSGRGEDIWVTKKFFIPQGNWGWLKKGLS